MVGRGGAVMGRGVGNGDGPSGGKGWGCDGKGRAEIWEGARWKRVGLKWGVRLR